MVARAGSGQLDGLLGQPNKASSSSGRDADSGLDGNTRYDELKGGATSRNGSYKALREASVGTYKQLDGLLTRTAVAS